MRKTEMPSKQAVIGRRAPYSPLGSPPRRAFQRGVPGRPRKAARWAVIAVVGAVLGAYLMGPLTPPAYAGDEESCVQGCSGLPPPAYRTCLSLCLRKPDLVPIRGVAVCGGNLGGHSHE